MSCSGKCSEWCCSGQGVGLRILIKYADPYTCCQYSNGNNQMGSLGDPMALCVGTIEGIIGVWDCPVNDPKNITCFVTINMKSVCTWSPSINKGPLCAFFPDWFLGIRKTHACICRIVNITLLFLMFFLANSQLQQKIDLDIVTICQNRENERVEVKRE